MKKGGITKKKPDELYLWMSSAEGKKKLDNAYECSKKVVDKLVKLRRVDLETLYRPFTK
jgi:hypothetical protein